MADIAHHPSTGNVSEYQIKCILEMSDGYFINYIGNRNMEWFDVFYQWFMSLGDQYGVNPIIFGSIYVGAIPFFTLSIVWLIRNYRKRISIILPVLSATFFFVSAYLYLIIVGKNVPWWIYSLIVLMLVYGAWSTYKNVKKQVKEETEVTNG